MSFIDSDTDTIKRIIAGDKKAFEILVDKYQISVFNLVLRFTENKRELAEEITQDVFIKVYKKLPTFKYDSKFSTWLYQIAFTTSMSEVRKINKLVLKENFDNEFSELISSEDWSVYIKDHLVLKNAIAAALTKLEDKDRLIIELFYMHHQTIDEICFVTGLDKTIVKMRLYRARLKIKKILSTLQIKDLV